jgi:hypothetical protein
MVKIGRNGDVQPLVVILYRPESRPTGVDVEARIKGARIKLDAWKVSPKTMGPNPRRVKKAPRRRTSTMIIIAPLATLPP